MTNNIFNLETEFLRKRRQEFDKQRNSVAVKDASNFNSTTRSALEFSDGK